MTAFSTKRRFAPRAAAVLAAVLALTACGSSNDTPEPTTTSSEGAFPITVKHSLGETTVKEAPERVVALIDRDADTLLALGIIPVGIRSLYGFETGVGPWAEDALGNAQPAVWTGRELDYEEIINAEPDLIVFASSSGDQKEYDTLSEIAPTITLPTGATPWNATMEQTTSLIAEATGRTEQGRALVSELDGHLSKQAEAHPEFAGKTATYFDLYQGKVAGYGTNNPVNATMYRLGFEPTASSAVIGDEGNVEISPELLPQYDADVVLAYSFTGSSLDELLGETPGLSQLNSVSNGRVVLLEDLAFSNQSVLSIRYALDRLLPKISVAVTR